MSDGLRVIHVISDVSPKSGGPTTAALGMCRALVRSGVEVSLFTTNIDERGTVRPLSRPATLEVPLARPILDAGFQIQYFPVTWPSFFRLSPEMGRALRNRIDSVDLLHVHSLFVYPTLMAGFLARQKGVPYVVRPHGTLAPYIRKRHRLRKFWYMNLVERRNLNGAAGLHFTSHEEMRAAADLGLVAPPYVVPLGVEPSEYQGSNAGAFRKKYALNGKKLVVFLGRLTHQKGLDLLIEAIRIASIARPDIHLVLAGPSDAKYRGRLDACLETTGVIRRTTMTGLVAADERRALLRDGDVFVLPSRMENFGMALVEAMASELPVIVTNGVHLHAQIAESGAGVVAAANATDLSRAIVTVLSDPVGSRRAGRAGRQLVEREFSWDVVAQQLVSMYVDIAKKGRTPRSGRAFRQRTIVA